MLYYVKPYNTKAVTLEKAIEIYTAQRRLYRRCLLQSQPYIENENGNDCTKEVDGIIDGITI